MALPRFAHVGLFMVRARAAARAAARDRGSCCASSAAAAAQRSLQGTRATLKNVRACVRRRVPPRTCQLRRTRYSTPVR
jgi:hypothetical protein